MTVATEFAKRSSARFIERVPREHGFWVMLSAVVVAALLRNPGGFAAFVAVTVILGAAWVGGEVRVRIRREERLQLASACVLAVSGVPVELAGEARLSEALANAFAWMIVFGTFTLSVWACRARSSRIRREDVPLLTLFTFLVPLVAATAFALADFRAPALASMLAMVSSVVFAVWRPGAKQMKAMGLSLAGAATFVALVLVVV
jgi:hypothetical protein